MLFRKKPSNEPRRVRQPVNGDGLGAKPVFSYHARSVRPGPAAPRRAAGLFLWSKQAEAPIRSAQRNSPKKKALITLAAILAVAFTVNSLILGNDPKVVTLTDAGNGQSVLRDDTVYRRAARAVIGGSFANTNKLTVNTAKIAAELREQFPELESVAVSLPVFGRHPVVYIQPSEPALLLKTSLDANIYVLDSSGRVIRPAKEVLKVEKLGLAVVEDQSGLPVTPGRTAISSDNVAFITEVVGQLKAKRLNITALVLPKGSNELNLRVEGAPYIVKFNLRGDARAEAGAFLAVKQHLEREGKTPSAYIDVRVDNKAYYR